MNVEPKANERAHENLCGPHCHSGLPLRYPQRQARSASALVSGSSLRSMESPHIHLNQRRFSHRACPNLCMDSTISYLRHRISTHGNRNECYPPQLLRTSRGRCLCAASQVGSVTHHQQRLQQAYPCEDSTRSLRAPSHRPRGNCGNTPTPGHTPAHAIVSISVSIYTGRCAELRIKPDV